MTWVTPTPTSPSAGVPATKFGIAIGSGVNSPSGTMIRFGACAEGVAHAARQHAERGHPGNDLPAARAKQHLTQSIFVGHVVKRFVSRFWPQMPRTALQVFRSVNTGANISIRRKRPRADYTAGTR